MKRRVLCFFALQIMLVAQMLMAQHATVHFSQESHAGIQHAHSHSDPGHHDKDKPCELCLFSKNLHDVLVSAPPVILAVALQRDFLALSTCDPDQKIPARGYLARAPPVFLS